MKELKIKFRWEKEFKETEIGEIPKDWEVKKLGDLLRSLESGSRPKGGSLAHTPNGVLSIGGENINWDGSLNLAECLRFEESFYNRLKRGRIEEGDILLVKDGATIGKLAFIKEVPEGKAMVNEHVFLLKSNNLKINPKFLFYFLLSEVGRQQIESLIFGSAQGGINKSIQDNILVFYPPLPEQSRIATVLSWFDDLIEVKKRQNEILEKTAMAIFKSWFIDFEPFRDGELVYSEELGKEIPKGWEVKKWGDVVNFLDNQRIPLSEVERLKRKGQYPYYGANGIIDYIDDYIFDGRYLLVAEDGTVMDKNGLAIINIVEGKFWANNHVHVIQGKDVPIDYLYLHLKHYPIEPFITGAVQPKLSQENFSKMPILLPPPPILQSFHSLVEPLFQKIILNQKQIITLRKIRDTLLPLLVFGKLRVEEV
jgi:type I restriction enzyme S subunit